MNANEAGRVAEDSVAGVLQAVGIIFDRQVLIGESIYEGQELYADFICRNLAEFPNGLILESKWQGRQGTIDEKFPYLVLNIQTRYPFPAIVIVHGGGCRPGALCWIRERCDHRLIAVLRFEEFMKWAMHVSLVHAEIPDA